MNDVVEQNHHRVKARIGPMLGLQSFQNARTIISGIELAAKIQKSQYDLRQLGGSQAGYDEW